MKLHLFKGHEFVQSYRMSPLLEVTEDTPPDMLTGSMDLRLVLPDGNRVRMSVDRRTPMMDLLVQVTTAYKISPAGNVLQPYGESGILPYKPSTPIGALDTWIVHIVPKNQSLQNPSNKINLKQVIPPFEQTLRFQVNLPRNQLYVTRVSGRCSMRDILIQACNEKNLDSSKYTLRHPKHLDKPLCDEMSIAEYGHNQVTMLSIKNVPTAVSTEDILMMNKYKTQSDSGSGSAASSVSPIPPVQPAKPIRKRRPAPKPPVQQKPKPQQSETIICHSRTSSDSSGYHEASVLSESPDSNNSSLPDSLPRRSKLPTVEPSKVESKLSRSLSNLHQASTSAVASSGLKPAQSTSCLAPSRKKKPAPAPPIAIAEEKEEKSATLPPCARLLETPEEPPKPRSVSPVPRLPRSTDDQVLVMQQRTKPRAPVPRPRSTAFESTGPKPDVFLKLEGIFKKMSPGNSNTESESARLEAEIERMFEQATREHVSLESGVELSRGPSPDWNWEYRLPAPPTFRDDVTSPSLAEIKISSATSSKPILFEPLESTEEVVNDESAAKSEAKNVNKIPKVESENKENTIIKSQESNNEKIHLKPSEEKNTIKPSVNGFSSESIKLNGFSERHLEKSQTNITKKAEKIYITSTNDSNLADCVDNVNKEINDIIKITPKQSAEISDSNNIVKQNITIKNQRNIDIGTSPDIAPKYVEKQNDKVYISIKNEDHQDNKKNVGRAKIERSDTVIRVNGRQERTQEQSAILNELTTVIIERQTKPKEPKPEQTERQTLPLKNFCITTYSGSKPVEIYKESPKKEAVKETNGIIRRNSFAEEKKGTFTVKRSASVVTNLQRRHDHSRSNGNLLEADEDSIINLRRSNLRKTSSELSINIDAEEEKKTLKKKETGLQSLQVLRTILPQLSQSQGALNTLVQINEKKEEKPAVCLSTWGERPKRQVSIKTDRDYVTSGAKLETPASVTIEVVSPTRVIPAVDPVVERDRRPRTSVYKSMETGNTKAIKLPASDLGRLPIVRSVELKKTPTTVPIENGFMNVNKPFGHVKVNRPESRQIRPPSYLFGCEPTKVTEKTDVFICTDGSKSVEVTGGANVVPPPPPAPLAPTFMKQLKPVSQRELKKAPLDPREELLQSIRTFGKSSLKKVSTR